ncbi:MAG: response regulator, partial [Proteobacteria bacterium]|nr:response regulator [Pseudomonadota bacterium]
MAAAPPADVPRIVVVDDEPGLRDMVAEYLTKHGMAVRGAADGAALDRCLAEVPADLVLLDVNMPGEDGFTVARRLRASADVAIIMVTAAGEVVDRVVGLEIGADDYVTKPFDLRELRARVRTVLRRPRGGAAPATDDGAGGRVRFGALTLDLAARRLLAPDGSERKLTAMEFDLLQVFAQNPNRVLSRDRLLDLAHHKNDAPFDRSIDIRIARLRRKIEPDPSKPQVIKTVR